MKYSTLTSLLALVVLSHSQEPPAPVPPSETPPPSAAIAFSAALDQLNVELRTQTTAAIASAIAAIPAPVAVDLGETIVKDESGLRAAIASKAGAICITGEIVLTEPLITLAPINLRAGKPGDGIKIGALAAGLTMLQGGKTEGLRFSGSAENTGDAIVLGREGSAEIVRCSFESLGRGIVLNGAASSPSIARVSVMGCTFKDIKSSHDGAIYLNWNVRAVTIRDNTFEDVGGGIWVGNLPAASGEISGNTIRRYSRNGCESFFACGLTYTGNTVEDYVAGSEGIGMSITGNDNRVIGNSIKDAGIIGLEHYGANVISTGNRINGLRGRPGHPAPFLGVSIDAATDGLFADNEVTVPSSLPQLHADGTPFAPPKTGNCFALQVIGNGGPTKGTIIRGNRLKGRFGLVVNYNCQALTIDENVIHGPADGSQMQYAVLLYSGTGHRVRRNTLSDRGAHPFPNGFFTCTAGVGLYYDDTPTLRGLPTETLYFGTNPDSTNLVLP